MSNLLFLIAFLLSISALASCNRNEVEPDEAYSGVNVSEIVKTPSVFYDKEIVVSGEVDHVFNHKAAVIGGDDFFGGRLLVISPKPLPKVIDRPAYPQIREGDIVQIEGMLRRIGITEIERDYDFDMERDFELEFGTKPVLVASNANVTARK